MAGELFVRLIALLHRGRLSGAVAEEGHSELLERAADEHGAGSRTISRIFGAGRGRGPEPEIDRVQTMQAVAVGQRRAVTLALVEVGVG